MTLKLLLLAIIASVIVACIDYKMKQRDIGMSVVMALGIFAAMFLLLFI